MNNLINDYYIDYINFTTLAERTKVIYINAYLKFWKEKIGFLNIEELTYDIVQSCLTQLIVEKKYSYSVIKQYKCSIMKFIKVAYLKGKIKYVIPYGCLEIGKENAKKDCPVKMVEFLELIKHINKSYSQNKDKYLVALWIGFYTGMRIGEVFALRKQDIDIDKGIIYIRHSVSIVIKNNKEIAILSNVKSPNAIRKNYMTKDLQKILKMYIKKIKGDILFSDKNGNYMLTTRLSSFISNFAKTKGYTIHFHTLRAMFVKRMVDENISLEIIRYLIGHKNINTVMKLYYYSNEEERIEAIKKVFDKTENNLTSIMKG